MKRLSAAKQQTISTDENQFRSFVQQVTGGIIGTALYDGVKAILWRRGRVKF